MDDERFFLTPMFFFITRENLLRMALDKSLPTKTNLKGINAFVYCKKTVANRRHLKCFTSLFSEYTKFGDKILSNFGINFFFAWTEPYVFNRDKCLVG